MPVDIKTIKAKGQIIQGLPGKKIDNDKLVKMLKEKAYTVEELAKTFGASKATVRQRLYQLKRKGINVKSMRYQGQTFYFIE